MATISLHKFLQEFRGNIDGLVVRKIGGKHFVGRKAGEDWKHKPTAGQKAFRLRFGLASAYAKGVQRDPARRAFYEPFAQARGVRVRAMAISDWFHPPIVEDVDLARYRGRAGDPITIRATDAFGVVEVRVEIRNASGAVIERGRAALTGKSWRYVATTTIPKGDTATIKVTAYDRPNRPGEMQVTWPPAKGRT